MIRKHQILVFVLMSSFLVLGWFLGQGHLPSISTEHSKKAAVNNVVQDESGKTVIYWFDPMEPSQRFDKPGKSPFMDMQLIPKYGNLTKVNDENIMISSQAMQNLGIRVGKVGMYDFSEPLTAIGRIEADERLLYSVQTRVPGFVERLLIRAVGDVVRKGQKIAEIYAPEILAAQQEYLALIALDRIDDDNLLKQAARTRLKLLGMSESEIEVLTKSNKPSPRFSVFSPTSGVITELGVREGGQILPGTSLMQLSDLSKVWLLAEVPERDASKLNLGLKAEVKLQSLPETYKGKVSYIYPVLNEASRTLQVRIELANMQNLLRPGAYANVTFNGQTHKALSVAQESVIETGTRKIVIIRNGDGFRPVEVETGQEQNGRTEILKGLDEGDDVVQSGQFLIDSEASLSGVLARLSKNQVALQRDIADKVIAPTYKGQGKVVGIDINLSKVTLSHKPIKELGWPAMTMAFKVNNSKQLALLDIGDSVDFALKSDKPNEYFITSIERHPPLKETIKRTAP